MSSRDWQLRVQDILSAIMGIQGFISGKTLEEIENDEVIAKAVLYNFMIVGEAARNIPVEIQSRSPEIPWQLMIGMRNVVAHEYFQIDLQRVWGTIQEDLPALIPQLRALLSREAEGK